MFQRAKDTVGMILGLLVGVAIIVAVGLVVFWFLGLSQDAQTLGVVMTGACALSIIPVCLLVGLLLAVARLQQQQAYTAPQPPVYVFPGQQQGYVSPATMLTGGTREFEVIGEEE